MCVCSNVSSARGGRGRKREAPEPLSPHLNSAAHTKGPVRPMTELSRLTWSVSLRVSDLMDILHVLLPNLEKKKSCCTPGSWVGWIFFFFTCKEGGVKVCKYHISIYTSQHSTCSCI